MGSYDVSMNEIYCKIRKNIDDETKNLKLSCLLRNVTMTEEALPSYKFQRKYYRSIFNQCKTCLCLTQIEEIVEFVKCIQSRIENKNTGH